MKYQYLLILILLISCGRKESIDYIQYVDPLLGSGPSSIESPKAHPNTALLNGQTIPAITAPFGMTQWTPEIHNVEQQCAAPYYYGGTILQGFRATHWLSGSCSQDYGSFGIFATNKNKPFRYLPSQRGGLYMLNVDNLSPAFAATMFPEMGIMTEMTATKRCGFFRFSWLDPKNATIIFDVNNDVDKGYIKIDLEKQEVYGYNPVFDNNGPTGISGYFVARFDKNFVRHGTFGNNDYEDSSTERQNQKTVGAYVVFDINSEETVRMKMGTSFTSIENARKNLETEISDWDFEATKNNLEQQWNSLLGKIEIETEDKNELTKFYTALYHSLQQPRLFSDVNGDYPAFSEQYKIKNTTEFDVYGDFTAENTFRAQMPLLSLIAPKQYNDMVKSILVQAEEGGWLPASTMANNYAETMRGDPVTAILTDAAIKGFDFDTENAYSFMLKNAISIPEPEEVEKGKGRPGLESYIEFGYIPLDETQEGQQTNNEVARTLEYSYNDWCVAQVARKLGKIDDQTTLESRIYSYSNVFDESLGWVNGRYSDGSFFEDFNASKPESFLAESSPKEYSFFVPHDIPGLIELTGGKDIFNQKLDDVLNSVYNQSNVAGQHIPYLYNYTGNWEKTQKIVKEILKNKYDINPWGLCGYDNAGQLSAWYVFSTMGFYPTCPGSNDYQLSSPVFNKITLHLDKDYYSGGNFVLKTEGEAKSTVFNEVNYNGTKIETSIRHEDIKKGGTLLFSK
ncbi:MAG TPA: GH92 family glycosyl hydrolase [Draconibacterium sp.]|nr:GH92 family glycosyl hydrolase [Draconibacterium sp.]